MSLTLPRIFTPPLRDLSEPGATWGHDFAWFCDAILRDPLSDFQEWLGIHCLEVLTEEKAREFAMLEDDPAKELEKVARLYAPPKVKGGRAVPNGMLRFTYVLILISRQNGKTDFVKKLIKYFFFRRRVPEIMAAAQTLNKAIDLWNEILLEIELDPVLSRSLGRVDHSKGGQALWSKDRRRRYRPVGIDENAGRGDTNDLLYIDELRTQKTEVGVNSLEATTTVPDNGLIVATSNAGSDHSVVLRAVRERAMKPIREGTWGETRIAIFEWSADPSRDIDDVEGWREGNPDLNHGRITIATLKGFRQGKSDAAFRTEHLCQWVDELDEEKFVPVLSPAEIGAMTVSDVRRTELSGWRLCVDASPERDVCSVAVAGRRSDGAVVGLVGYHGPLVTADVVGVVLGVCDDIDPAEIIVDPKSPAWVVGEALEREGLDVRKLTYPDVKAATGAFLQGQRDSTMFLADSGTVAEAFEVAELKADANGGVRWARRDGKGIICQLTAVSYAMWAAQNAEGAEFTPVKVKKLKTSHGSPAVVRRQQSAASMSF